MVGNNATIDEKIQILEERKRELINFIQSAIEEMLEKRKGELKKLGVDVDQPEVDKFIKDFKNIRLDSIGKKDIESIEKEIEFYKSIKIRHATEGNLCSSTQ